jgi:uncharacterized protein YndB with AHSA1/START domain
MTAKGKMTVAAPGDREIVMTRIFDAPRRLVWDAWTRPDLVKRWMVAASDWTMAVCEMDLRPGGALRWVWRSCDGKEMGLGGVFHEVEPPLRIVHTELYDEDWTGGESLVTVALSEHDGKTTVTLTVLYSTREARDGVLKSGMEQGLGGCYDRLEDVLAEMA